jgi:CRP/FNR family cyclic AMP-dependent transcriptional regulator
MSHTHLLRNVSLFAALGERDLEDLSAEFVEQRFVRGQVIFPQGSATNSLYIVRKGSVEVTSFNRDRSVAWRGEFGPEQSFGEFALLDGLPRSGEAVAQQNSDVLVLDRGAFFRYLERHPAVAIRLLVTIARRMRFAESAVEQPVRLTPEQKIAQLLIDVADRYPTAPTDTDPGPLTGIALRLTADDLAGLSGVTRATAGQVVEALRQVGIVAVERSHIIGVDVGRLSARLAR